MHLSTPNEPFAVIKHFQVMWFWNLCFKIKSIFFWFQQKKWDWIHCKAQWMTKNFLPCQTTIPTFQVLSSKQYPTPKILLSADYIVLESFNTFIEFTAEKGRVDHWVVEATVPDPTRQGMPSWHTPALHPSKYHGIISVWCRRRKCPYGGLTSAPVSRVWDLHPLLRVSKD